jgi:hypothetical protein
VAEVGERHGRREHVCAGVEEQSADPCDLQSARDQARCRTRNGEEAVAHADVLCIDDAGADRVRKQGDPEPGRDEQRCADVSDREDGEGSTRTDSVLDPREHEYEQCRPQRQLVGAREPESACQEHAPRIP